MMIFIALFVVLTLIAVLCIAGTLGRQANRVQNLAELVSRSKPLDIESFRNLIDPEEEKYLSANLPKRELRSLQRARMLASLEYIRRTGHNAKLLLQFADSARRSPDPEVSDAGIQLAESALRLRLYSILAMCFFAVRYVFPSVPLRVSDFVSRYESLRARMTRLTRIQRPASVSQVEAAL